MTTSRRQFLVASAAGAGGLLIGFGAIGAPARRGAFVNGLIKIDPDGDVTVYSNVTELGQGTSTAIVQFVAEELDAPWEAFRVEPAPLAPQFVTDSEMATGGSGGTPLSFRSYRRVAAAARLMLIAAAAARWRASPDALIAESGRVRHPDGRSASYGALATEAALQPVPANPVLKPRSAWKYIGKPVRRLDLAGKVDGSATYAIDVRLPGILTATLTQAPVWGSKLNSVDSSPALRVPGVRDVVRLVDAVAVVGDGYWPALQGLRALSPIWSDSPGASVSSELIRTTLAAAAERGAGRVRPEDAAAPAAYDAAIAASDATHASLYELPLLTHATMEPMSAVARATGDGVELWVGTQAQSRLQQAIAVELGCPIEKVAINTTLAGGGFGRRSELDFPLQAVRISKAIGGRPVKLIWSREEDFQHGFYRPASALRLRAGLNSDGYPCAFAIHSATPSIWRDSVWGSKEAATAFDFNVFMGAFQPPYALGAVSPSWTRVDLPVRAGTWRSVAESQNVFAVESFIDELAARVVVDPVAYRERLLQGKERELAVLRTAARRAGWGPSGETTQGVAMSFGNRTVAALIADIDLKGQQLKVRRLTCVIDCGFAVNPDSVRAQIEGGLIWGLSAALTGEISVKAGRVQESNFHEYPILSLAQTPQIDVEILETQEKPRGVGEEAVAPVAPAIANAIFRASGRRIQRLPFSAHGLQLV